MDYMLQKTMSRLSYQIILFVIPFLHKPRIIGVRDYYNNTNYVHISIGISTIPMR